MGNNPSYFKGDKRPVESVSWNSVQDYIRKLNKMTGRNYRLPTEAEWEYACRSGGKNQTYCGSNNIDSVAWYSDNSGSGTHSVGQKDPNGLGLYDMTGNVWEWVQDRDGYYYYRSSPTNDPKGPSGGTYRVIRGGSWGYLAGYSRSASRYYLSPGNRSSLYMGFRLARTR